MGCVRRWILWIDQEYVAHESDFRSSEEGLFRMNILADSLSTIKVQCASSA
jgi:hypothetical protein